MFLWSNGETTAIGILPFDIDAIVREPDSITKYLHGLQFDSDEEMKSFFQKVNDALESRGVETKAILLDPEQESGGGQK